MHMVISYLITEVLPSKQCHSETERVLMHGYEQNYEHYCNLYHSVSGSCRVEPLLRLSGENYNEEIS